MDKLTKHWDALAYGVRAGIAIPMTYILYRFFQLPHGYWAPMTTCLVLQMQTGATFKRSFDRTMGHLIGATLVAPLGILWFFFPLPFFWLPLIFGAAIFCFPYRYMAFSVFLIVLVSAMYAFSPPYYMDGYDLFSFNIQRLFDILMGTLVPVGITLILFPRTSAEEFESSALQIGNEISHYLLTLCLDQDGDNRSSLKKARQNLYQALQINQEKLSLIKFETMNIKRYYRFAELQEKQQEAFLSLSEVDISIPYPALSSVEETIQEDLKKHLLFLAGYHKKLPEKILKQAQPENIPSPETKMILQNDETLDQTILTLSDFVQERALDFHRYTYYLVLIHLIAELYQKPLKIKQKQSKEKN